MRQLPNFIGGDFVAAKSGAWRDHVSPVFGAACGSGSGADIGAAQWRFADSNVMDVVGAIQSANQAWKNWQKVTRPERAAFLAKIADQILIRTEDIALTQARDQGMPIASSRKSVLAAAALFRFYADLGLNRLGLASVQDSAVLFQNRLPLGLVAVITPWTDAFYALGSRVAPALLEGNVVIAKPSEFSPATAAAFSEVVQSAGLPPGVCNMVHGLGVTVGAAITAHPGLSTIAFMGQTETGRSIQKDASELIKRTHLALGARNPVLVFNEVQLEKTVSRIAQLALMSHGPICLRGSRIFVQESIYQKFLELLKVEFEKAVVADPLSESTTIGPLVSQAKRDAYFAAIRLALNENGKLLTGGLEPFADPSLERGYFVRPTAIYDLTHCSTLQQEEVIGPFVTISSFKYQHEAIKHANTSPFAQAAYVFCPDGAKALRVATQLEASQVFMNIAETHDLPAIGFSGMKNSGIGANGALGLMDFFSRQSLVHQGRTL